MEVKINNRKPSRERVHSVIDAVRRNNGNTTLTSRELGIPRSSIQNMLSRCHAWYGIDYKAGDTKPAQATPAATISELPEDERHGLESTIRTLKRSLQEANEARLTDERIRKSIFGLAGQSSSPPDWLLSPASGGAPGIPVTIWSDWHWGEVVRADEVGGINTFSIQTAHERIRRLVNNTIDLCMHHMVNPKYPGIVICLGGDMISGDIHEELAISNELETLPTLIDLRDKLIWALSKMADTFGRVFVPCVVGNHGRQTHKPRAKARIVTNYEWLLYQMLEKHFVQDDRIKFLIPRDTDAHFNVAGHRYMLTHGDSLGVKGGDGMIGALGPIMRGTIKLRNSESRIGREFDTVIMGHWHQYVPMPGCIVNGSLVGFNEYAKIFLRARYQPPIQALWFTHPKHGVTFQIPIYLDEVRSVETEGWVSWCA